MLRRLMTSNPVTFSDFILKARYRQYSAAELVNGIVQGDYEVIVATTSLAAVGFDLPPRKGDQVVIHPTIAAGTWTPGTGATLTVQNPGDRDGGYGFWMQARGRQG